MDRITPEDLDEESRRVIKSHDDYDHACEEDCSTMRGKDSCNQAED